MLGCRSIVEAPSSVRAAMARRVVGPATRRARAACTCWPSSSSTTEEKVLPSTWASLVGLAPSLLPGRTRERETVEAGFEADVVLIGNIYAK